MGRPIRYEKPGAVYHIISRGNNGSDVFKTDRDKESFLETLVRTLIKHHFLLHAYCVMTNHYHLLVETPRANLSQGMHSLNSSYARRYNLSRGLKGHVFEDRFSSFMVGDYDYFMKAARYIVLNPVKARIVDHPSLYPWSNYRFTSGLRDRPEVVCVDQTYSVFTQDTDLAQYLYTVFVLNGAEHRSLERDKQYLESNSFTYDGNTSPTSCREGEGPPAGMPLAFCRHEQRPPIEELFSDSNVRDKRNRCIVSAHIDHGYSLTTISSFLKLRVSTISIVVARALDERVKSLTITHD